MDKSTEIRHTRDILLLLLGEIMVCNSLIDFHKKCIEEQDILLIKKEITKIGLVAKLELLREEDCIEKGVFTDKELKLE